MGPSRGVPLPAAPSLARLGDPGEWGADGQGLLLGIADAPWPGHEPPGHSFGGFPAVFGIPGWAGPSRVERSDIAKRRDEGAPLTARTAPEGQWTGGKPPDTLPTPSTRTPTRRFRLALPARSSDPAPELPASLTGAECSTARAPDLPASLSEAGWAVPAPQAPVAVPAPNVGTQLPRSRPALSAAYADRPPKPRRLFRRRAGAPREPQAAGASLRPPASAPGGSSRPGWWSRGPT